MKRLISFVIAFLLVCSIIPASLVFASPGLTTSDISSGVTYLDLVEALLGPGIDDIQNISYTGTSRSAGTFSGGTGIIGFESGIILSSGWVSYVVGPNSEDGKSMNLALAGDSDLDGLIPGYNTNDAVILEFDFIPAGNTLTFDYVFGSEEYNEFVGSVFNDVFGFFLNGTNVALLPDGVTPVAINNVNNDLNSIYYIDNDFGDLAPPYPLDTELDGVTTVLTVNAAVTPNEWNHIKLGIADAGDHVLDSDVFIKTGSFSSIPDLYLEPDDATNNINTLHTLTATYTIDDVPVASEAVHFEVISGPHIGTQGNEATDASGVATWDYTGTIVGIDEIKASLVDNSEIVSNVVTKTWIDNGPGPGPDTEVGGEVYPTSKLVILTPWIVLAIVIAVGTTILIRRRQNQS